MGKKSKKLDPNELSKIFAYARELERTSVIIGEKGSALNLEEYEAADEKLGLLRSHVLEESYYTSVMSPAIVQPTLRSRGVDLSAAEIRGVLNTDPMKGSAPTLKLILDTPDLLCHRSGVSVRLSEKTKPSGRKIEQAVKVDIGRGNHDRLEFEDVIKKSGDKNPGFDWGLLQAEERELVQDVLKVKTLDDLDLKVWMFLFGSNWQTEFMPDGNTDILIKQKHDRYHIRDIFGWEAYVAKAENEADQDYLTKMLASGTVKPKDHIKDIVRTLDDVQAHQIAQFPEFLEREKRSIYQQRFDHIAKHILPRMDDKSFRKKLSKGMGSKKFKTIKPAELGL